MNVCQKLFKQREVQYVLLQSDVINVLYLRPQSGLTPCEQTLITEIQTDLFWD